MHRIRLIFAGVELGIGLMMAFAASAQQTPTQPQQQNAASPLSDMVQALPGAWEFSDAEREKTCILIFKLDTAGPGRRVDFDKACGTAFPVLKNVAAWRVGKNDVLQLVDSKGQAALELDEVENGLFESSRGADSLYFMQTQAAAEGREHTADQMFGDWAFTRGNGKPICQVTLLDTAANADGFAIRAKPGCDALITNFAPQFWHMDRGQFVLVSTKNETWRFEEGDPVKGDATTWHRIPEGRQPVLLVKQ